MIKNNVKEDNIGYIEDMNGKLIGTCFCFCNNYIFTARHVIEKFLNTISLLKCVFPNIKLESNFEIKFENEVYDIAILKLNKSIDSGNIFLNFATTEAEIEDKWESNGYPLVNGKEIEYVDGTVRKIINNNPCTIYELRIRDAKNECDWSGLSGAPLIINNEIAGVIIIEVESNIKSRLKAISFLGIFELLENEEVSVIRDIKSNYDCVLQDRMSFFKESIDNIFYKFSINEGNINRECFLLKSKNDSIEKLVDMLYGSIREYGTSIILYRKSKEGNYKERKDADTEIQERTKKILKLISSNEQLVYILLWTLAEGARQCPRIGSRILDTSFGNATDIYIDEKDIMNIYFSCGKIDDDYFKCIDEGLAEINKYINNDQLNLEDEVIDWDELVVSSLNYSNRKKIKDFRKSSIDVGIFMIYSFEYYEIYKKEDMFDENHDYELKKKMYEKFIDENKSKIEMIIKNYNWISKINIVNFVLPFNDLAQFQAVIEQKIK